MLRSRFDRAAAARILLSLDAGMPLRDAVAQALHDPTLEIVYRLGDREGWVDETGREVGEPQPSPERAVTTIERNGRRVAALVHDPTLAEEPDTIDLVASAAGCRSRTRASRPSSGRSTRSSSPWSTRLRASSCTSTSTARS